MSLLAIDPGPTESAYVILDGSTPVEFAKVPNGELLGRVRRAPEATDRWAEITHVAIEMIASYGMPVGREVFETCLMIGRIQEAWPLEHTLVYRREVKLHLCGQARAKDPNIRAALIDMYGGKEQTKKGGRLYGITKDCWAALGVAVTHSEQQKARAA